MEPTPEQIGSQLRKPEGEFGVHIAEKMSESNAKLISTCIQQLNLQNEQMILEIGFGSGKHVCELLEINRTIKYHGVDFSQTMVEEAIQLNKNAADKGSVHFQLGNISNLPYEDASFDSILTVNTIYFWEHPNICAKELFRVLKPGGKLILGLRPGYSMKSYPFTQNGFTFYEEEEVRTLLTNSGFRNTSARSWKEGTVSFLNDESFDVVGLCVEALK